MATGGTWLSVAMTIRVVGRAVPTRLVAATITVLPRRKGCRHSQLTPR